MLNSCCYWEDIHMFSISCMSNLFSRGLRRYLSHALWVFKIVSSLNLFKLISRSGGQWTFRMTLVTVGYICFSLMDKNVKPGAALGGDRGCDCLCSQHRAAGCASLRCFGARFTESARHTVYLCNTYSQPRVATSDSWQLSWLLY